MQRGGQKTGLKLASVTLRINQNQTIEERYFVRRSNAGTKVLEVRAASEGDVLAVIDVFSIRQHVRSCAAAEERAALEERHPRATPRESHGRGQSGEAAADDRDPRRHPASQ